MMVMLVPLARPRLNKRVAAGGGRRESRAKVGDQPSGRGRISWRVWWRRWQHWRMPRGNSGSRENNTYHRGKHPEEKICHWASPSTTWLAAPKTVNVGIQM